MKHQFRVLCVDDYDTCELLSTFLGFSGIEVIAAHTDAEAWRLAQIESFDLYLLETRLSDGDGFELCRRLYKFALRTPIVFYSAEAYATDRQKGLAAGATAYLVKPYFDDLAATILEIIKPTGKPGRTTDVKNIEGLSASKPFLETICADRLARVNFPPVVQCPLDH